MQSTGEVERTKFIVLAPCSQSLKVSTKDDVHPCGCIMNGTVQVNISQGPKAISVITWEVDKKENSSFHTGDFDCWSQHTTFLPKIADDF